MKSLDFFPVKDRYVDVNLMFPLETIYFRKHTQSFSQETYDLIYPCFFEELI